MTGLADVAIPGMSALTIALLTFAGLIAAAVVAAIATRRVNHGDIETSTAETLWDQNAKMRDFLADALTRTTARLDSTTLRLDAETDKLGVATERIAELMHQVAVSRAETAVANAAADHAAAEAVKTQTAVRAVYDEVKTGNAQTLGVLGDNAESRRVALIPEAERTAAERTHLGTVGISDGRSSERAEVE